MKNPLNKEYNNLLARKILEFFPEIPSNSEGYLSLHNYITSKPQKYYSQKVYESYLLILEHELMQNPSLITAIFKEKDNDLFIANKVLNEVNTIEYEEPLLPESEDELIFFIQEKVNYNIIKLLESPIYVHTYVIARLSRISRGKNYEGLDLFNVMEELNKTNMAFLRTFYDNVLRNSIAHGRYNISSIGGNVYFNFFDKNNNVQYEAKKLVNTYDQLINIANALLLAFKVFIIKNKTALNNSGYSIPIFMSYDEIKVISDTINWKLKGIYDFVNVNNHKTISVFINSNYQTKQQNLVHSMVTAGIVLKHLPDSNFININIDSKWTNISTIHYDCLKLKKAIDSNWIKTEPDTITLLFWIPKYRFLDFMPKLFLWYEVIIEMIRKNKYEKSLIKLNSEIDIVRNIFETRNNHSFINADCVLSFENKEDLRNYLTVHYSEVVESIKINALSKISFLNKKKYLPIKFIRAYMYIRPVKARQIQYLRNCLGIAAILEFDSVGTVHPMKIFDKSVLIDIAPKYRLIYDDI